MNKRQRGKLKFSNENDISFFLVSILQFESRKTFLFFVPNATAVVIISSVIHNIFRHSGYQKSVPSSRGGDQKSLKFLNFCPLKYVYVRSCRSETFHILNILILACAPSQLAASYRWYVMYIKEQHREQRRRQKWENLLFRAIKAPNKFEWFRIAKRK